MALSALVRRLLGVALAHNGAAKELADAVDTNTSGSSTLAGNNAFTGNNTHAGTELFTGAVTITDVNVVLGTTTGTKFGTAVGQKLAFHGSTPVAQRASANQAVVTTTVGSAVAGTAATNSTPYGYSQAQADAIVANINALRVDLLAMNTLLTELRAAEVEKGLIKGAA